MVRVARGVSATRAVPDERRHDRNLPLRIAVDLNAVFGHFRVRGDIIADGDRGDVGDARSAATAGPRLGSSRAATVSLSFPVSCSADRP